VSGRAGLLALAVAAAPTFATEFSPQLSMLTPFQLEVTGPGFVAPLGEHFLTIPLFSVEAGVPVYRNESYSVAALVRIGYGQKRAITRIVEHSLPDRETEGTLHWMPMQLGARARFFLSATPFFRPSVTAGIGGSWLRFDATDAPSVSSFVPLVFVTPAIHLFEPIEAMGGAVFQGFTFGLSYQRALFSVQRFQGFTFELSAQWTL
jgi:hypothetical protein